MKATKLRPAVLPTSVLAAPVWTDGLDGVGEDAAGAPLVAGLVDGFTTVAVFVLTFEMVEVTLPYDGGIPPPDGTGLTGGGAVAVVTAVGLEDGAVTAGGAVDAGGAGTDTGVAGFWICPSPICWTGTIVDAARAGDMAAATAMRTE